MEETETGRRLLPIRRGDCFQLISFREQTTVYISTPPEVEVRKLLDLKVRTESWFTINTTTFLKAEVDIVFFC